MLPSQFQRFNVGFGYQHVESISVPPLSFEWRDFSLFSAPECTLAVAVEGEMILFPCYQAKTDANQTKQKTPIVSPKP